MSSETGTASVDIELDNLVLTMQHDDDHPRLLKWLGEGDPDNKAQIAFTLSSANLIPVDCEVSVYPLARTDTTVPVRTYTIQHGAPSPGPVSADWDGRDDQGQFVPPGLYAFDIDAVWAFGACPHCADWRASRYLSLYLPEGQGGAPEAEATYLGFVDGKHQFEVSYVLRDHSRNAGAGQIICTGRRSRSWSPKLSPLQSLPPRVAVTSTK